VRWCLGPFERSNLNRRARTANPQPTVSDENGHQVAGKPAHIFKRPADLAQEQGVFNDLLDGERRRIGLLRIGAAVS
jgi:hypothetical protein